MYHVAAVLYSWPDLRLTLTQRLPNICSPSETRLMQLGRHRVASQKDSPSGGWLSGRVWADSCPGGLKGGAGWQITGTWEICALLPEPRGQPHLANG